jgi:hypothetical protein
MTTTAPGGVIPFDITLTFTGLTALNINDPVMVVGDYEVDLADGTKPTVGAVEVPNVRRQGGVYPVANPGGEVTCGVRGHGVKTVTAAGAIAAGARVRATAAGYVAAVIGDEGQVGIALTAAGAAGDSFDLLYN